MVQRVSGSKEGCLTNLTLDLESPLIFSRDPFCSHFKQEFPVDGSDLRDHGSVNNEFLKIWSNTGDITPTQGR